MKKLKIRSMILGEGREKLICPITEPDADAALEIARVLVSSYADAVELRADLSRDAGNIERLRALTRQMRDVLGDMPLMFTYRTEGAKTPPALDDDARRVLLEGIIKDGAADMVDIEHTLPSAAELIALARERGVVTVYSMHDFDTLPKNLALARFVGKARRLHADVAKIACATRSPDELIRLLKFTKLSLRFIGAPLIAAVPMDEQPTGRLMAGLYGSCMCFCSYGEPCAPGQLELEETYRHIVALNRVADELWR